MADNRAGESANSQAVTVQAFQELLDFFTSALLNTIERAFSKNSLGNYKQEIIQKNLFLEDQEMDRIKRLAGTAETKVLVDVSIPMTEKQQMVSLLQADNLYGNKFWLYGQRNGLNDYTNQKRRDEDFKLENLTSRRERVFQKHQPQITILKVSKIKLGGLLKEFIKKKDWKKYKKK